MFYRILSLFLLLPGLTACVKSSYSNLDSEQLNNILRQDVLIYDIRRADEWKRTGVIEGSKLLTYVDAGGNVQPEFLTIFTRNVGKDDKIILICHVGDRSRKLAQYLSLQMGYSNVYNVQDGIKQWINDGRPVARI
ncbi:MAG: rhodanese-like domain-containing protein [Candidatus Thiodiazotropha sp. (ex Monitilora ramsayi)]|nr:rhodanese-like domain-containing protein [Candidatus Thiodiazotropha sp. (ex Monitilora ramsayi)]